MATGNNNNKDWDLGRSSTMGLLSAQITGLITNELLLFRHPKICIKIINSTVVVGAPPPPLTFERDKQLRSGRAEDEDEHHRDKREYNETAKGIISG